MIWGTQMEDVNMMRLCSSYCLRIELRERFERVGANGQWIPPG
jgi:hypothetical protein